MDNTANIVLPQSAKTIIDAFNITNVNIDTLNEHESRLLLQNIAFILRDYDFNLKPHIAKELNTYYQAIIKELEATTAYDGSLDYPIDFNNYVESSTEYQKFAW